MFTSVEECLLVYKKECESFLSWFQELLDDYCRRSGKNKTETVENLEKKERRTLILFNILHGERFREKFFGGLDRLDAMQQAIGLSKEEAKAIWNEMNKKTIAPK